MSEKLFDLNDFKGEVDSEILDQLEQMERFLIREKALLKKGEYKDITFEDYIKFCRIQGEPIKNKSQTDFICSMRFWFNVAGVLSAQGKINAKRFEGKFGNRTYV